MSGMINDPKLVKLNRLQSDAFKEGYDAYITQAQSKVYEIVYQAEFEKGRQAQKFDMERNLAQ